MQIDFETCMTMRVDLLRLKGRGDGVAHPVCDPTFCSWGFGGCVSPPPGSGEAPEANEYWQQSIEIWLKIRSLDRRLHP